MQHWTFLGFTRQSWSWERECPTQLALFIYVSAHSCCLCAQTWLMTADSLWNKLSSLKMQNTKTLRAWRKHWKVNSPIKVFLNFFTLLNSKILVTGPDPRLLPFCLIVKSKLNGKLLLCESFFCPEPAGQNPGYFYCRWYLRCSDCSVLVQRAHLYL